MPPDLSALRSAGIATDTSARRRAEYSTDASLYRVVPAAVVFPRTVSELVTVHEVCRAQGLALTVRGAGTSIAGNAVGPGVVADVSRHLTSVLALDPVARTAVVEPGVVLDDLQRAAAPYGLRFGPDPSTHDRATVGGMIGNNACGARALRYGRTADNVLGLDVLTGGGARIDTTAPAGPTSERLREVVDRHLGVIRTEFGRFGRQVSGYSLEHLLPENGFDVARFLVGTEGTCALTLSATVRLVAAPTLTRLVVLGYPDMPAAADAVPALLPLGPVAMEGIDARIVEVVRRHAGAAAVPPLPRGGGWLFVEVGGDDEAAVAGGARDVVRAAGALAARIVTDSPEAAGLWRIREDGAGLSARPVDGRVRHAGWEDSAVPPDRLGDYLRAFEELLTEHRLTGLPYGHFGDGCLHVRLDFALDADPGRAAFRRFLTEAATLVAAHGGSLSGEHGDGRARSELLAHMYSPAALRAMAEVKAVLDPDGTLNPGVVVAARPLDADLRDAGPSPRSAALAAFGGEVQRCTGVGKCRADRTEVGGVMCPSYLATGDEKDSTRGRSRVLQELVDGRLVQGWRSPEVRESLDLCLSCKACASECPTGVDMATYKSQVLDEVWRGRIRPPAHYALGWLPAWARVAARAPRLANTLLGSPLAGAGKRLAGVDGRRDLPTLAGQSFRAWFTARPRRNGGDLVLLWVDTFTDLFAPQVGRAAVTVLERAGHTVAIPDRPQCCGLTWISTGQRTHARKMLLRSISDLEAPVAAGVPVVGLEPSCVGVLRGDVGELLGPAAARTGAAVRTLAEFLTERAVAPPDLRGVRAVAQPHCHHHAVMGWDTDARLLREAGAEVVRVGGCCGLAGNFGVERGHHDVSMAIAELALLPAVRRAPDAVVLTDGFSCRTQLEQLGGRSGIHLAELLAAQPP